MSGFSQTITNGMTELIQHTKYKTVQILGKSG